VKSSGIQELDRALDHITADMPSDVAIDYHSVDPVIVGIGVDVLLHLKEAAILLTYEYVLTSLLHFTLPVPSPPSINPTS
jgi:hypothetical protein